MKNKFIISVLFIVITGNVCAQYVDLGLPSGTLWKTTNEYGFYSQYDAIYKFDTQLPYYGDFMELLEYCSWSWTGNGYRVTGKNGNSIILPAAGYKQPSGSVVYNGSRGTYWGYDTYESNTDAAISLFIAPDFHDIQYHDKNSFRSVRLVKH